jgi:hypothetical protein
MRVGSVESGLCNVPLGEAVPPLLVRLAGGIMDNLDMFCVGEIKTSKGLLVYIHRRNLIHIFAPGDSVPMWFRAICGAIEFVEKNITTITYTELPDNILYKQYCVGTDASAYWIMLAIWRSIKPIQPDGFSDIESYIRETISRRGQNA